MRETGLTLPELALCLLLLGAAAQTLIGPIRHQADLLVARGAREEFVALVRRARMEARARGEVTIELREGADPILVVGDRPTPRRVSLAHRNVRLEIVGSRTAVRLNFGPLGVARFASASLVFRRRTARVPLVVSSYGRVRR